MPTAPDIRSPAPPAAPAAPVTLADAWALWLAYRSLGTRPLRASTLADYESIYRAHLGLSLGDVTLAQLHGLTVARFVIAKTAEGVGARRLSNVLVPLRACLRWHHRMGTLAPDPSPWFDVSAPAAEQRRVLTIPEIERLIATLPAEHRAFVAFAAYVGTRAGEQRALTWADVDLVARTARIDKTLFRDRPQRSTKTGRDRLVPLPPHIATMLAEWRPACPCSPQGLVFPARSGRPLDLDTFRTRVFKPAVVRAGLSAQLRFHDLRHTAASLLLQSGASVRDVMEICGWSQLATAQRYLHPTAVLGEAAERVSAAREGVLLGEACAQAHAPPPRYFR